MKAARIQSTQEEQIVEESRGSIDALEIIAATLAGILILLTLVWQTRHYFATPFYDDMFDRLRMYRALPNLSTFLSYLVSPHNEHRILTTRLVAFVDEFFFSGREYTQVVVTNGLQLCSAYLSYSLIFNTEMGKVWTAAEKIFAFSVIALLFINPNLLYTLIVPFQLQHAIMAFLCIISAYLVSRHFPSQVSGSAPRALIPTLLVLAFVGTFTLGNAPAILMAAAATSIVMRLNFRFTLILTVLAIVHTVIIFATTTAIGVTQNDPVQILKFSLLYWGAPFLRFGPWPVSYVTWWSSVYLAGAFGAAVLGTAVLFALLRFMKPGLGGRTAIFGFMVLVIVIVTGVAAAHSRAQFGFLEASNKKYASFAALGWLGVLAVLSGVARQRGKWSRRPEMAVFAAMMLVLLPLAVSGYARETRLWQKESDRVWEAGLAAFLQVNARNPLHDIYTEDAGLGEYLGYVAPSGRGIFAHFPFRWGDNAKEFLSKRQTTGCRSVVETLNPISAADLTNLFKEPGTPVSISGWTWMDEDHVPPEMVIAVDSRDRIVGAARTTRSSSSAEEWLGQKLDQDAGWYGFARVTELPPVTFYALSRDGKRACTLGGVGNVR